MGNNTNPICSCVNCMNRGKYAYPARRRGGNNAYLCEFHRTSLHSYYDENNIFVGKPKAHGITTSCELETMYPTEYARLELCLQGFLPTHDSTVSAEFKSPIMNGFNTIGAYAETIEFLKDNHDITINGSVGLHTHMGHRFINSVTMAYIRRFYHSLFCPVMAAWKEDSASKYIQLFGRKPGDWAEFVDESGSATSHTNMINVQHEPTIEFRSPRFQTAEQYLMVCKYLKQFMLIIVDNFIPALAEAGLITLDPDGNGNIIAIGDISEKTDGGYNAGIRRLSIEQRMTLKKAADKTASKLVKQWQKLDVSSLHWTGEVGDGWTDVIMTF